MFNNIFDKLAGKKAQEEDGNYQDFYNQEQMLQNSQFGFAAQQDYNFDNNNSSPQQQYNNQAANYGSQQNYSGYNQYNSQPPQNNNFNQSNLQNHSQNQFGWSSNKNEMASNQNNAYIQQPYGAAQNNNFNQVGTRLDPNYNQPQYQNQYANTNNNNFNTANNQNFNNYQHQETPRASQQQPSINVTVELADAKKKKNEKIKIGSSKSSNYDEAKSRIFAALIEAVDLAQLSSISPKDAKAEIEDVIMEIIQVKNMHLAMGEQEAIIKDICDDILGYGPLEPLLARDDIADIMVNGANTCFIEVGGKVQETDVKFRDNAHLLNICQKIASQVGRRVDESSPICDARLPDGSRVNVIAPPLAIDGTALTIRKFKRDKLTLQKLVEFGSISPAGAVILSIVGKSRCNILISGGTGSGKTTLLNCLTGFIETEERIITCEDSAELQLQQPHVVRLETRPPNLEGEGEVTMRDLVKNCLRMRPERIIVGEVRGPEAFDLLQAMNTGHDGSMGTLHANSPREALSRLESMITMGYSIPQRSIREMIVGAIDVIVQAARLRDGSRRITHVTEVMGMEGDTITLQDIFLYKIDGEDANGKILGRHVSTGIAKPNFWDKARYYKEDRRLAEALSSSEVNDE